MPDAESSPTDQSPDDVLAPAHPDEPLFGELDEEKRTAGRSCCTLWTLGILLVAMLILGLAVIFRL